MPDNNLGGSNQFGNYTLQPGYGDVAKQTALTREAPMSGSPIAANAIGSPKRATRTAARQGVPRSAQPPAQGPGGAVPGPAAAAPPTPEAQAASVWQQIAQTPGASPLVQQYAAQAASGS